MSNQGYATIWFCDPNHWSASVPGKGGCGFFGLYKPETDTDTISRNCPSCGRAEFYARIPNEVAVIKILNKKAVEEVANEVLGVRNDDPSGSGS